MLPRAHPQRFDARLGSALSHVEAEWLEEAVGELGRLVEDEGEQLGQGGREALPPLVLPALVYAALLDSAGGCACRGEGVMGGVGMKVYAALLDATGGCVVCVCVPVCSLERCGGWVRVCACVQPGGTQRVGGRVFLRAASGLGTQGTEGCCGWVGG